MNNNMKINNTQKIIYDSITDIMNNSIGNENLSYSDIRKIIDGLLKSYINDADEFYKHKLLALYMREQLLQSIGLTSIVDSKNILFDYCFKLIKEHCEYIEVYIEEANPIKDDIYTIDLIIKPILKIDKG